MARFAGSHAAAKKDLQNQGCHTCHTRHTADRSSPARPASFDHLSGFRAYLARQNSVGLPNPRVAGVARVAEQKSAD
jgi:hypothetical protein